MSSAAGLGEALFRRNPALVQLLGLSPLLAIAATATLGLALGAITALTLIAAAALHQRLGRSLPTTQQPLAALMIAAAVVSVLDLLLQLMLPALRGALGPYLPLVAGNCVLAHALGVHRARGIGSAPTAAPPDTRDADGHPLVAPAARSPGSAGTPDTTAPPPAPARSPRAVAAGFALLALLLGAGRELIGSGALFTDLALLGVAVPGLQLLPTGWGWRLALLPPGAFFALAAVLAVHRQVAESAPAPSFPASGQEDGVAGGSE